MNAAAEEFVASKSLAVVGVSRTKGFGNLAFRELRSKGYRVYPVNANADVVEGEKCFHKLDDLPEKVDGVVAVVHPADTEKVVGDCARLGIRRVWMQQGSESEAAIRAAEQAGISVVHHACVLMYAQPRSIHKVHRALWRWLGKL